MRRAGWGMWVAFMLALAGCATHPPGTPFEVAHRRALLQTAAPASGLTVQWFGVTTLLFREGDDAILIDAFLSRPSPRQTLLGAIGPDRGAVRNALAGPIAAVFIAHAHHDHVLDASAVVHEKGALLFGSESVLNVARGDGVLDERLCPLDTSNAHPVAGFTVHAFATPHSKTSFPMEGVRTPLSTPARALAYSAGRNDSFLLERGGRRILVVPSAASKKGMFGTARSDVVFLGIGGLGTQSDSVISDYCEEAVRQRGARQVILVHWDNFLYPPGPVLQTFAPPLDDVPRSLEVLSRLARDDGIDLHFIAPFQPVGLPQAGNSGIIASPPAIQ